MEIILRVKEERRRKQEGGEGCFFGGSKRIMCGRSSSTGEGGGEVQEQMFSCSFAIKKNVGGKKRGYGMAHTLGTFLLYKMYILL